MEKEYKREGNFIYARNNLNVDWVVIGSANDGWWCEHCKTPVQYDHATYEETHDPRSGGCGNTLD